MHVLHMDSSPRCKSHSRELSAAIVRKVLEVAPGASVSRRDLGFEPLPHTASDYAAALASPATLAAPPEGSLDGSEALIREVEAADVMVIGTPMYNFTVPSVLKAWSDQILRAGRTWKSARVGKVGVLRDRPAFIGVASGAIFSGDPANQPSFLTPYLRLALNTVGIKAPQFVSVEATEFLSDEQAALLKEKAVAGIDLAGLGMLEEVDSGPTGLADTGRGYRMPTLVAGASCRKLLQSAPKVFSTTVSQLSGFRRVYHEVLR